MTLKTRNRLFLFFLIIAVLCGVFNILLFLKALLSNAIIFPTPTKFTRFMRIFAGSEPFKYSFYAVLGGILFFHLYVILVAAFTTFHFEKTQALEVIYFYCFLLGCLMESARLVTVTFNLWRTTSITFLVLQRITIAGRLLAPMSLLFASLFNGSDQRENVEQNIVILFVVAALTGITFPVETTKITSTFEALWGFREMFAVICLLLLAASILAMVYTGLTNKITEMRRETIGYIIMMAGYYLLWVTDNYMFLGLSMGMLSAGTFYYLHSLHSIYLWK